MQALDIIHRYLRQPGFLESLDKDTTMVERYGKGLQISKYPSASPVVELEERTLAYREPDFLFTYYGFVITTSTSTGAVVPAGLISGLICTVCEETPFSVRLKEAPTEQAESVILGVSLDVSTAKLLDPEGFRDLYWYLKDTCNGSVRQSLEYFFSELAFEHHDETESEIDQLLSSITSATSLEDEDDDAEA